MDGGFVFRVVLVMGNGFRGRKDRPVSVGNAAVRRDVAEYKSGFVEAGDLAQEPVRDPQVNHPGSHGVPPVCECLYVIITESVRYLLV